MNKSKNDGTARPNPLDIYWRAAATQKGKLVLAVLLACVGTLLELVPFVCVWLLAREAMTPAPDMDAIWTLTWIVFASVIVRFAVQGAVTVLGHMAGFHSECVLRERLVQRLAHVKPAAVEGRQGQTSRAIMDEVGKLNGVLAHNVPDLVASLFLCLTSATLLFWVDWRLALAGLCMLFAGLWAQSRVLKVSPELFGQWMAAEGRAASELLHYVRGIPTLKAFNRQADSLDEVRESIFAIGALGSRITHLCSLPFSLFDLAMGAPLVVILPLGLWLSISDSLPVEDFLFFLAIGGVFLLPMRKVMNNLASLRSLQAAAERLKAVEDLQLLPETTSPKIPRRFDVRFEKVSHAVVGEDGERTPVLRDVDFELAQGKVLAVVGPSGSGKTTLARLLARLDDPESGRILMGGADVRDIPARVFEDLVSVVFQDPILFHGTLRENIRLARPNASDEDVARAFEAAGCARMIEAFPEGLDSPVSDRGQNLSGGEQQRVALARAFLKDAPILVLDEAAAHLDPLAAKDIAASIKKLAAGKTVFAISHRLCDMDYADSTLVVVDGRVEAQGTHEELLSTSPCYARLWGLQTASSRWRLQGKGSAADNGDMNSTDLDNANMNNGGTLA